MGVIAAIVLLSLAAWWFVPSPKTGISWLGMIFFILGLFPVATITSFHPVMLLAVRQSIVDFPVPLGIAIMAVGHYLATSKAQKTKG